MRDCDGDSGLWSASSRREQLDKIWQFICDLPSLDKNSENVKDEVEVVAERLKLIETILKHKREEQLRATGVVTETISDYNFNPHYYFDEEDIPDPVIIVKSREHNKKTVLNVGGERHEVSWRTLMSAPLTRLGRLALADTHEAIMEEADLYSLVDNEYFFDRHPRSFLAILNFYRTGRLHVADEMCVIAFNDDLEYWGISDLWLESCCQNKFLTRKEFVEDEMRKEAQALMKEADDRRGSNMCSKAQGILWDLFEKPESSVAARIISWVSVLFVVVSTVAMVLNTMPEMEGPMDDRGNPTDNTILSLLETICILWFTIEYLLRFFGAPKKCAFLKDAMNIVDVLAILPYYISLLVMEITLAKNGDEGSFNELQKVVSVFRIMRILRIFKLARHSSGLQSIAYTLKNSYKELALLVLFLSMGVLVFSSLCYFAEKDVESTQFTSIPATFWWAVITMTTVGYGDMHPTSLVGKMIGKIQFLDLNYF